MYFGQPPASNNTLPFISLEWSGCGRGGKLQGKRGGTDLERRKARDWFGESLCVRQIPQVGPLQLYSSSLFLLYWQVWEEGYTRIARAAHDVDLLNLVHANLCAVLALTIQTIMLVPKMRLGGKGGRMGLRTIEKYAIIAEGPAARKTGS